MYSPFIHYGVVSGHEGGWRTQNDEKREGDVLEQSKITLITVIN